MGEEATLVEYGAGASVKTRILLDAASSLKAYAPIDVSEDFLQTTADALRQSYPELPVFPVVGDFLGDIVLPPGLPDGPRTGFFPGSTIGNLSNPDIIDFMVRARQLTGSHGKFVLGFDLRKSTDILIPAYDDAAGVTAAFNLNLLARANRELGTKFNPMAFRHEARWNAEHSRIEMHLVSETDQQITLAGQMFNFARDETIHTENSRKFSIDNMTERCGKAGWQTARVLLDPQDLFAVSLLVAEPA